MTDEWIGTRWIARCLMHLPTVGAVRPGEEFTFTERCAADGLRPDLWLAIGNAELVGGAALPATTDTDAAGKVDAPEPEPTPDIEAAPAWADTATGLSWYMGTDDATTEAAPSVPRKRRKGDD